MKFLVGKILSVAEANRPQTIPENTVLMGDSHPQMHQQKEQKKDKSLADEIGECCQ